MKSLLKIPAWQMFIFLTFSFLLSIIVRVTDLKFGSIDNISLLAIIRIFGLVIYFFWMLILGLTLNNRPIKYYKFNNLIYVLSLIFCILGYTNMNLRLVFKTNNYPDFFALDFLTPLFVLFGLVYSYYSLSKSLKSSQLRREVRFSECILDLVQLLIFPIGIWFIQPKLNLLSDDN
jgi:hypothetical protein